MKCVNPPEMDGPALLAYVDGEAGPEIAMHIEGCPYCRQRAQTLEEEANLLSRHLFRARCPSSQELGEFELNLLPAGRRTAVAQHLLSCPYCARETAELRAFLQQPDDILTAGPLTRLAAHARVWVAELLSAPDWAGALGSPAAVGLRGESDHPFVYQAGAAQVVIEVQADADMGDRRSILGLITGLEDPQTIEVAVWQDDHLVTETQVDGLGNFVIDALLPGSYELILSGPETEIHIQDFPTGAP